MLFSPLFFLLPLLVLTVLIVLVLAAVVLAVRPAGPDPRGRRPYAVYLLAAIFLSLWVLVTSVGLIGAAAVEAITDVGTFGQSTECFSTTFRSEGLEIRPQAPFTPPPPPEFSIPPFPPIPRTEFTITPPSFPVPIGPPEPQVECVERSTGRPGPLAIQALLLGLAAGAVLAYHADLAAKLIAKEASHG